MCSKLLSLLDCFSNLDMANNLPKDCAKQWEVLLLLIASEEKKIERINDNEINTMSYFLRNEGVKHIFLQWLHQMQMTYGKKQDESDTALKCDDVSVWCRQEGNKKFRANLVHESYRCYTNSVLYAFQHSSKYSLALANRSAALLRLKRFEECLADIELAISAGYPAELQYKLLIRRADCYLELNKREQAVEALTKASEQALLLNLTETHTELDRHINILKKKLELLTPEEQSRGPDVIPDCYKGENPDFHAASSALELKRSEIAGRHVVTREVLQRGDVIFSEEPYAWVALSSHMFVCDWCCAPHINPLPCKTCSRIVYCNEECRSRALSYHRWECVGAQAELFPTIGIAHLALRVLLMSTISGFPSVPPHCQVPSSAADLFRSYAAYDNIQIYNKDTPAFYRMFNLVTNFDKMKKMDYIQYALTATMLTLYLEHFTNFFEHLPSSVPYALSNGQLRLFASAVILRALGQLVCNGHAALSLATVDDDDGSTVTEREVRRATAIYPSAAMMNHSCDPNIINTFYKCRLIVRCSRDVESGADVLNCYGPHRARQTSASRRSILRAQYLFTCSCTACLDVERRDFALMFSADACASCKGPVVRGRRRTTCAHCHKPFRLQRVTQIVEESDGLLAQAERATSLQERIAKTHAAFRLKQQVWYRHNTDLRTAADHLARLYADNGDFSKSAELIKQNIQSLEYQFGSFSVEVAHELRKLVDVMLERVIKYPHHHEYRDWCLETHKITKKAVQLMELNYGSWENVVKRLQEQEALVAALVADTKASGAVDSIHDSLHYNLKI